MHAKVNWKKNQFDRECGTGTRDLGRGWGWWFRDSSDVSSASDADEARSRVIIFFSLHLKIISHFDSLKKSSKSQIEIPNSSKVISQRLEHTAVGFEISRDELLQSSLLYNILGSIWL